MSVNKIILIIFLASLRGAAQETKNILFLGNSYTYYNNLTVLVTNVAASTGDTAYILKNTLGGYTLEDHSVNNTSHLMIRLGYWDFVVLQEQSQRPSLPIADVETLVYPFARKLNDSILAYNPCAETTFYMTWGRKNGDATNCSFWPPVCTYEGMDDLLRERYLFMAEDNDAIVSPVGAVWRYLRANNPEIELYDPDESHPSLLGSYVAAVTFYTTIFKKDPNLVTYDSTLSSAEANIIKNAVKTVVFDNLSTWFVGEYDPVADFSYTTITNLEYSFTNTSSYSNNFLWDFGDGTTSIEENPIHVFPEEGVYDVSLQAGFCYELSSVKTETISVVLGVNDYFINNATYLYPNPSKNSINIHFSKDIEGQFSLSVFSTLGTKVYSTEMLIENKVASLDLGQINKGNYFLVISKSGSIIKTLSFIKE